LSLGGTKTSAASGTGGTTGGSSGGSGGGSPTGNVTTAIKSIGNSTGVQLVISLQGAASAFPASSKLTSTQESALLSSQLIIGTETSDGKSLTQSASAGAGNSGKFELALSSNGANLASIEVLGSTLYARVDINQTATTYGLTKGKAEQAQQELAQAGSSIPGLSALSAGKWVSLDLTPLLQLEQKSASTSTTTSGSAVSPASEAALVSAFLQAFEQNSQITEVGPADGGTKYQAVVREKALVTALGQASASIPGLGSEANKANASNIPATQTLTVDVVVKGGALTDLQLPLNQFDKTNQLKGPLTLDVGFSGAPTITAPQGATAVDLSGILSQLGSLSGGSSASSSATSAAAGSSGQ